MKSAIVLNLSVVLILKFQSVIGATTTTTSADRIRSAGYVSENHEIRTKDGYIITIFRIRNSTNDVSRRPVVLMWHGLLTSSECWVIRGLTDTLAYDLVDSGYDVWLGNARGNTYGKRHVSLSPDDPKFWRFSWHEIAMNDLPQTIDYILEETQQTSLHYVGHSQGTTIMFVLLSMQPEYNAKFKTSHMLAPVIFCKYIRALLFELLAVVVGSYSPLDPLLGDSALFQQPILRQIFAVDKCREIINSDPSASPELCRRVVFLIFGGYSAYFKSFLLQEAYNTHPSTASTHQAIHYIQQKVSGYFRQYDFGVEGNMARYNQSTPPDYNLANVNTRFPIHLYYSDYDELSTRRDIEKLTGIMGSRSVEHFIPLKNFAHIDFLWATNVKEVQNNRILQIMNDAEVALENETGP
ncbi:lipase 3-like [Musca vetustissima]|uniref:lipase 3-like n=1 Tax=Musca vetustissima TaxID=27455 RepID=UPI002AB5FD60|nr:lipase 3-like [Musca vetustissima]